MTFTQGKRHQITPQAKISASIKTRTLQIKNTNKRWVKNKNKPKQKQKTKTAAAAAAAAAAATTTTTTTTIYNNNSNFKSRL